MTRKLTKVYGWHEALSIVACRIDCVAVDLPAGSYSKNEDGELDFSDNSNELNSDGTWFATFADAKRAAIKLLRQQVNDAKGCLSIIRRTKLVKGEILKP